MDTTTTNNRKPKKANSLCVLLVSVRCVCVFVGCLLACRCRRPTVMMSVFHLLWLLVVGLVWPKEKKLRVKVSLVCARISHKSSTCCWLLARSLACLRRCRRLCRALMLMTPLSFINAGQRVLCLCVLWEQHCSPLTRSDCCCCCR